MDNFDKLIEVLEIRYKDHQDPRRSAYSYLVAMSKHYVPDNVIDYHLDHTEKQIIMDTLKA